MAVPNSTGRNAPDRHSRPGGQPNPGGPPARSSASRGQDRPASAQNMRLGMQRELKLARQIRAEAESYRLQTETRARSDAQRLLLDARLSVKREISKLESEAGEQARKLLADIRVIRLAALQELEAQRQFTRAAKIRALADMIEDQTEQTTKE